MSGELTLLTFAPMIDSETSRLLLRHYGVAYREEPHVFGWASVLSLLRVHSLQVPALYGKGVRLAGPRAIVDRFDSLQPPGRALLPRNATLRSAAEADWARYNGTLATKTAMLAYYHLLPYPDILMEPFTRGVPAAEASALHKCYPLLRWLLTVLLRLNDANARAAIKEVRVILDETDRRVDDGRRFLLGDQLTLGDFALVAAVAPLSLPDGNDSPIPPLARMPPDYAQLITETRSRPIAPFVQELYNLMRVSHCR